MGRFGRRRSASERRRRERIDGGTQFLAISERQAKFPEIRITYGRQHRCVDLLGAEDFDMLRQADFLQPTGYVDGGLPKLSPNLGTALTARLPRRSAPRNANIIIASEAKQSR